MRMPTYRRSLARSRSPRVAWTVASAAARASTATLALVWEAACSTGQTGGIETTVAPAASGVMSGSGAMNLGVSNTVTAISTALPLSPDSAFKLLKAVYAKLEIPIAEVSDRDRTIGNEGLRAHRTLAGMAMQEVLDCGDKMGVLNAEVWDIQVNLQSYVKSDPGGGSQLFTRLSAVGHDPTVADRDWIPCESKSGLEARIADMVKAGVR